MKVIDGPENRVIFLGMDQDRDELLYCNVKGKNPFKDLRVRKALYQAIDIEAMQTKVMRGLSVPTGASCRRPGTARRPEGREAPARTTSSAAKKLLAEAGYPNGFEVTLDCPNNRYINDEEICIALAACGRRSA